jgi:hypothetical protein
VNKGVRLSISQGVMPLFTRDPSAMEHILGINVVSHVSRWLNPPALLDQNTTAFPNKVTLLGNAARTLRSFPGGLDRYSRKLPNVAGTLSIRTKQRKERDFSDSIFSRIQGHVMNGLPEFEVH